MEPLDEISTPRGFRVLARLPGLPENLHDSLIQKFKTLPRLLGAPTEKLFQVDGIGRNRAQQLRDYFDTLPSDPFPADPRCQQLSLQRRRNVVCPSQLLLARRSASLLF